MQCPFLRSPSREKARTSFLCVVWFYSGLVLWPLAAGAQPADPAAAARPAPQPPQTPTEQAAALHWAAPVEPQGPFPVYPVPGDYSSQSLREFQQRIRDHFKASDHDLPLDVKAEYFEWQLWRYHRMPYHSIDTRVRLPEVAGTPPAWWPDVDGSTWNGSLLAALSHKYAVTHDARTSARIAELLEGMHFFFEVTGMPGLAARCVRQGDGYDFEKMEPYTAPDGTRYYFRGDPARGGYNQIAAGYASCLMFVYADLPPASQARLLEDASAMVLHLIEHDYKLVMKDGKPTPYGNITPNIGGQGLPFNGQVAYAIVAMGKALPLADGPAKTRIAQEFTRLRDDLHVYYEHPLKSVVKPQNVAASPFVKGMNDRNHAINAAFTGLMLEIEQARRLPRQVDGPFVHQLGQTMALGMDYLKDYKNGLCFFMWGAVAEEPGLFDLIVERKRNTVHADMEGGLIIGMEQLRRFGLDRFEYDGHPQEVDHVIWVNESRPDSFFWKCPPHEAYVVTGPANNDMYAAIDYVYAYWLMRHYRLDQHPKVVEAGLKELGRTVGVPGWDAD